MIAMVSSPALRGPPFQSDGAGDTRLHLQSGPIDLIIEAWGEPGAVRLAYRHATTRFAAILDELVSELENLRSPWKPQLNLNTPVARRMFDAVAPFGGEVFITPMAAVAGAVADEILEVLVKAAPLDKAYVNNGGDIAVHVTPGETLAVGLVEQPDPHLGSNLVSGQADIKTSASVGGIATSGRFGRSFSLGIADAVTVAAKNAASADVAATLIANAVNIFSPLIQRLPAQDLDPDSDLGDRLVTTEIGDLNTSEIEKALLAGLDLARHYRTGNLIEDALLRLKGHSLACEGQQRILSIPNSRPETS